MLTGLCKLVLGRFLRGKRDEGFFLNEAILANL